ncbi:MAG: hypothetical protein P8P74_13310 [Crocinitomicaceae bacterium]|nr:hypothetical protein [Crocinitomicaceae bacterium]
MKAFILSILIAFTGFGFAQETETTSAEKTKTEKPKKAKKKKKKKKSKKVKTAISLDNALVIAQMDTPEDRYSIEILLTEMLTGAKVNSSPSLNVLKLGSDSRALASDSVQKVVALKGIDTYCLVSIRGFDRNYNVSNKSDDFETSLNQASFFELYRIDAVSISFQFKFFRDNKCVHSEVVKCGNIGSRSSVLKRFRKKVGKRIKKSWAKSKS